MNLYWRLFTIESTTGLYLNPLETTIVLWDLGLPTFSSCKIGAFSIYSGLAGSFTDIAVEKQD